MIYVFTDGSSSRKYNTIGFGVLICKSEDCIILSRGIGLKDSSLTGAAELLGILTALSLLLENNLEKEDIILYCDSQYALNECTKYLKDHLQQRYVNIKNSDIIINIIYRLQFFKNLKFEWVKGHQIKDNFDSWGNNIVDKLAVESHKSEEIRDNLFSFKDIIEDIKKENKENKYLDKNFNFYLYK